MLPPDAIAAAAALFIVVMVWLRTRMHYPRGGRTRRGLTHAGALYFAALGVLLVCGWFAAPPLARSLASPAQVSPTFARVAWFLLSYYGFIPLHRLLKARGLPVFRSLEREMA